MRALAAPTSTCQAGLMETMQGAIGLEPARSGEGASFWIELPLHLERPSTFGSLD